MVAGILSLAVALAVTVVATPAAARLAHRTGVLDRPGPLKVHSAPVPYLGGLAVFAGVAPVLAAVRPALLVPTTLALALGLADDVRGLRPATRLLAEVAIGGTAASLVDLPGPGVLGWLLVAGATVVLINAVNLLDGLDAVAAGVTAAAALGMAGAGAGWITLLALAVLGATCGFLVFNRPPARIYLGDAGAYLLGTVLALLLAGVLADESREGRFAAGVLLLAVPVADTTAAVVRRVRARRPLFQGDRGHVYDRLVAGGWSTGQTSLGCSLVQAALSGVGVLVARLAMLPAFVVAMAVVLGAVAAVGAWGLFSPDGPDAGL